MSVQQLVDDILPVADAAGQLILKYFEEGTERRQKTDGSPVTQADIDSEKLIIESLLELAPDIPIVGEEAVSENIIPDISAGTFFLIDPLDATREFVEGGREFSINIALMQDFKPVAGIIHLPALNITYYSNGQYSFVTRDNTTTTITVRPTPAEGLTIVTSKNADKAEDMTAFLKDKNIIAHKKHASAYKLGLLAEGAADMYPRLGPSCEWDIAAGDAILRSAGGRVTWLDGTEMTYGHAERRFLNPSLIALGQ